MKEKRQYKAIEIQIDFDFLLKTFFFKKIALLHIQKRKKLLIKRDWQNIMIIFLKIS